MLIESIWYVAITYDNSPLSLKIKKAKLKTSTNTAAARGDIYHRSPLIQELNQVLEKNYQYKLRRDNNIWYLSVADQSFALKYHELKRLFHSHASNQLRLKLNKTTYNPSDLMGFSITSSTPGFVSILYAEASGKSWGIIENCQINKHLRFTSKADKDELIIANPTDTTLTEMYIAVWSESPISLDQIYPVTSDYLDESAYNLDDVFALLSRHRYVSKVVNINCA